MKQLLYRSIAVLLFSTFFNFLKAQDLKGFVVDSSNSPIDKVSVFANEKKITETNSEGIFTISEAFKFPLKIRLEHPDFYIGAFKMSVNNEVFQLFPLSKSEKLEEVIISSTYYTSTGSTSKLIIPTNTISSEKFDTYSPMDLVSAINETPGVLIQNGALNTNRITIRGVGSRTLYGTNKIRAYFNGIPITNGIGETAIDVFDPEDLQSLEVVKGPKATQYGTNLGGTLLLNSKQAAVGESFLKTNFTIGSFGLIKNTVSVATSSEKFSVNLNYDHLETAGFRENSDYDRKTFLLTSKSVLPMELGICAK